MNKNQTQSDTKPQKEKSQVVTFRLPYSAYENYERRCIELQIEMSALLKQAVNNFLHENKAR